MSEYKVNVEGPKPPRASGGKWRRFMARIRAVWVWLLHRPYLLILGGLLAFVLIVGTPHIGWQYECRMRNKDGTCRYYGLCDYYGIQGKRVLLGEECGGLVKFLPINWRGLIPFSTGDRKNTGLILTPPK